MDLKDLAAIFNISVEDTRLLLSIGRLARFDGGRVWILQEEKEEKHGTTAGG
jgi:hypothetical protein